MQWKIFNSVNVIKKDAELKWIHFFIDRQTGNSRKKGKALHVNKDASKKINW